MKVSCRLLGAVFAGLFPFVTIAEPPGAPASGIEGVISMSPSRPGPVRKDSPDATPVSNVEFVVKRGEEKVTSFTTNVRGSFQIFLPPGHYMILRGEAAAIGHWRFEAEVKAGEVTKVNWTADSGMR